MIPSARPTVPPLEIIIFNRRLIVLFFDILKSADARTCSYVRKHVQKWWPLPAGTVGRPSGSTTIVIKVPLGQPTAPVGSEDMFFLKKKNYGRTDTTCENNDHSRPWLKGGRPSESWNVSNAHTAISIIHLYNLISYCKLHNMSCELTRAFLGYKYIGNFEALRLI